MALACAAATACANPNTSVMLVRMPSRSIASAARTPAQVPASLIRTRLRGTPAACVRASVCVLKRVREGLRLAAHGVQLPASLTKKQRQRWPQCNPAPPFTSYIAMMRRARASEVAASNDRRMSTCVCVWGGGAGGFRDPIIT